MTVRRGSYMTAAPWKYPDEFVEALGAAGVAVAPDVAPSAAREAFDDAYKAELRRLRDRRRSGEVAREHYFDEVVALRKRFWLLTLPLEAWERICSRQSGLRDFEATRLRGQQTEGGAPTLPDDEG
jgi:hypothetical protein